MRKSLCGSLKHLGADLYSSPAHFLQEMIQNAEDTHNNTQQEQKARPSPKLRIQISPRHLLLSNNEPGFRPKDVLSICSLAETTKNSSNPNNSTSRDIGQKGLGFKSIFSATDNPTIVSAKGSWRFSFKARPDQDEMQNFITPHWIEKLPQPLQEAWEKDSNDTHFFLPLKASRGSDFLDQVVLAADEHILLNLHNLRSLVLDDRRGQGSCFEFSVSVSAAEWNPGEAEGSRKDFQRVQASVATLTKTSFNRATSTPVGTQSTRFHQFECVVKVPKSIREDEGSNSRSSVAETTIMLAFPELGGNKDEENKTFAVFAGLPISGLCLGFRFLINCDFILNTSRESVIENAFNAFLRDAVARFFVEVYATNPYVSR